MDNKDTQNVTETTATPVQPTDTTVKEEPKATPVDPTPVTVQPKKQRGALFWVMVVLGTIVGLVLCCCVCMMISVGTSPEFKEGYCLGLEQEGVPASEDPLGMCD